MTLIFFVGLLFPSGGAAQTVGVDEVALGVASGIAQAELERALNAASTEVEQVFAEPEPIVEPEPPELPERFDQLERIEDLSREAEKAAETAAVQEEAEADQRLKELRRRERRTAERLLEMTRTRGESLSRLQESRSKLEDDFEELAAEVREATFDTNQRVSVGRLSGALRAIYDAEARLFDSSRQLRRALRDADESFVKIEREIEALDASRTQGRERERAVLLAERSFRELRIELLKVELDEIRDFHEYLEDHRKLFEEKLQSLTSERVDGYRSVMGLTSASIDFTGQVIENRAARLEHATRTWEEVVEAQYDEFRTVEFWTWAFGLFARILPLLIFLVFGRLLPTGVERLFLYTQTLAWGRQNQQKLSRIGEFLVALCRPTVQYAVTWLALDYVVQKYESLYFLNGIIALYFTYKGVYALAETVRPTHERLQEADIDEVGAIATMRNAVTGYQWMSQTQSLKFVNTVRRIGLVSFLLLTIHQIIVAEVGFTLLNRVSWRVALLVILVVGLVEIARWKQELAVTMTRISPPGLGRAVELLNKHVDTWYGLIPATFAAIYLFVWKTLSLIRPFVLGRTWFRSLSGFVFRTRLENQMRAKDVELRPAPDHYLQRFRPDRPPSRIQRKSDTEVEALWTEWQRLKTGASVIVGRHGCGKSSELERLGALVAETGMPTVPLDVRSRFTRDDEFVEWMAELLGLGASNTQELISALRELEPKCFLVDDAHRTFARRVGGYDAFDALSRIVDETSDTHFWALTFDEHSWRFVNYVRARVHRFRRKVELPAFGVEELHKLIKSRHEPSGLELHSLREVGETIVIDENSEVEGPFRSVVRYIHEVTDGIPASALEIWQRSVSMNARDELIVRLDDVPEIRARLRDDDWFVLAALVQHATLTLDDLVHVENVEEGELATTLQRFVELGYVERRGSAYQVTRAYLPDVVRRLIASNFLYE